MKLVYIDETDDHERKYSAAVAFIIEVDSAKEYRRRLIGRMREIFCRGENDATPFPPLHAARLPETLSDEAKAELFAAVLETAGAGGYAMYRIGYHWEDEHIKDIYNLGDRSGQERARIAAFTTLRHELSTRGLGALMMIQELDQERLEIFDPFLNFTDHHEGHAQLDELLGSGNILEENVGYYYAPNRDHFLYAADFLSYYQKIIEEENPSEFKAALIAAVGELKLPILRNGIVPLREVADG